LDPVKTQSSQWGKYKSMNIWVVEYLVINLGLRLFFLKVIPQFIHQSIFSSLFAWPYLQFIFAD